MSDTRSDQLEAAIENSATARAARWVEATIARWAAGSRIVQWFVAESDQDVVVIELRETYTVGPVLRVTDRIVECTAETGREPGSSGAANTLRRRIEAEPVRVVGVAAVVVGLLGCVATVTAGAGSSSTGFALSEPVGGWLILLGLGALTTRERRSAAELAETRLGRAVRAAFAPPEPPREG
jgi:hypothetical protein